MPTAKTSAAHTPGPWHITFGDHKHGQSFGGYWQIDAEYDAVACNQFCMAGARDPDVGKANACLIAAAPEMLAALNDAESILSMLEDDGEAIKSIRSVIAKAEGRP